MTEAFRLGFMHKLAEIRKSAAGSMSADEYARRGIVVPWAKTKEQLETPAPTMTPEQYASRGIKPLAPNRTAAGLTKMIDRHLDEGDAAVDAFESEGAEGWQARDTFAREQVRKDQANKKEIADYMAGMSPEDRAAFLAQKAKTPEGTVAIGKDGKPMPTFAATTAMSAVTAPNAPAMKTRQQLNDEESAARAAKWSGNSTVKWTPKAKAAPASAASTAGTGTRIITGRGTGSVAYRTPAQIRADRADRAATQYLSSVGVTRPKHRGQPTPPTAVASRSPSSTGDVAVRVRRKNTGLG